LLHWLDGLCGVPMKKWLLLTTWVLNSLVFEMNAALEKPLVAFPSVSSLTVLLLLLCILYFPSLPGVYHVRCSILSFSCMLQSTFDWSVGAVHNRIVWFDDIDWNWKMNYSSFNKIAEFGCHEFILRSGLYRFAALKGWTHATGGVYFQFKQKLLPLQTYQVCTRMHSCDERWFYLEHRFQDHEGKALFAVGFSKIAFRNLQEEVQPRNMLRSLCLDELANFECGTDMAKRISDIEVLISRPYLRRGSFQGIL